MQRTRCDCTRLDSTCLVSLLSRVGLAELLQAIFHDRQKIIELSTPVPVADSATKLPRKFLPPAPPRRRT